MATSLRERICTTCYRPIEPGTPFFNHGSQPQHLDCAVERVSNRLSAAKNLQQQLQQLLAKNPKAGNATVCRRNRKYIICAGCHQVITYGEVHWRQSSNHRFHTNCFLQYLGVRIVKIETQLQKLARLQTEADELDKMSCTRDSLKQQLHELQVVKG